MNNVLSYHIGAYLRVDGNSHLKEGEVQNVCLTVTDEEQSRERDIAVSLLVVPNDVTSGR